MLITVISVVLKRSHSLKNHKGAGGLSYDEDSEEVTGGRGGTLKR